jgi:hypothetical protein
MIPHRSVPVPPPTHDPKAVFSSAAKLAALVGTTCLFVALITGAILIALLLQVGAPSH